MRPILKSTKVSARKPAAAKGEDVQLPERRERLPRKGPQTRRPKKVGANRMFMRLRHDHRAIPESAQIIRGSGWQRALVVNERLAERLRRCISPLHESVA